MYAGIAGGAFFVGGLIGAMVQNMDTRETLAEQKALNAGLVRTSDQLADRIESLEAEVWKLKQSGSEGSGEPVPVNEGINEDTEG